MALLDIISARKSVRKYQERLIEREKILTCIEAARLSPSAENVQPWRFFIFDNPDLKKKFCREVCSGIYRPTLFIEKAPVVVVIVAKLDIIANRLGRSVQGTQYYLLDIGIAGEHLVLQAQELGIGTCWIGWFNARKAKKFLSLSQGYRVIALIAMGYPAERATKNKPDLPLEKICFFNYDYKKL